MTSKQHRLIQVRTNTQSLDTPHSERPFMEGAKHQPQPRDVRYQPQADLHKFADTDST